jgi:hypothetical protein
MGEKNKDFMDSRAMAQAVSGRSLTAEARVQFRVSPCGICGGPNGTGAGFSPSTSTFLCQFYSTGAPLHGKMKKTNHLHHSLKAASIAPAAGPFTKKKDFMDK